MNRNTWVKEVALATTTVSLALSDFVSRMFEQARTRYVYQKAHPREKVAPMELPPEHLRSYNSKLCLLLLTAVPEEVKVRVLEEVGESTQLTVVSILDEVWNFVAPGGQEEIEGLTVATAAEARKIIRTWLLAIRRAVMMSIPDLSPFERMTVLLNLVKGVDNA